MSTGIKNNSQVEHHSYSGIGRLRNSERRHLSQPPSSTLEGRPNHHQLSSPSFMTGGTCTDSYLNSGNNCQATQPRRRRHEASQGATGGEFHLQSFSSFLDVSIRQNTSLIHIFESIRSASSLCSKLFKFLFFEEFLSLTFFMIIQMTWSSS